MRLCLLVLLLQVPFAAASESKNFWVLANPEPPFIEIDQLGRPRGYVVEMVQAILNRANIDQQILTAPWPRLLKEADHKDKVLIFALARTPEREDQFHWIAPITRTNFGIFAFHRPHLSLNSPAKLQSLGVVSTIRDDFREAWLKNHEVGHLALGSWDEALMSLAEGRVQGVFFSTGGLGFYCQKAYLDCAGLNMVYDYPDITSYLVLSKTGSDSAWPEKLSQIADEYRASEEFRLLQQKWMVRFKDVLPASVKFDEGVLILGYQ